MTASACASFHAWRFAEIYSSADGSVQFIELHESLGFSGQNALSGHTLTCSSALGTHTYTFSINALSTDTANKDFLIAFANLSNTPGGVKPDYAFTNAAPFLFANSGTLNFAGVDLVSYTNLPTDGRSGMIRSGSTFVAVATNSPRNFSGVSNSIVPVRFTAQTVSGGSFVVSFSTATGTNGTIGPNYAVEAKSAVDSTNWSTVTNVTGNGTIKTVAFPFSPFSNMFFRLRVP